MSNYTKTTNFASKDNLSPGNPLKIVKGTEIDTEFNNIQTAVGTKTDNASANITGGSITGITDLAVADGGTGASTATAALNNLLPSQTSNANKYLQTDGTNATWDAVSLSTADITGTLPVANGGTGVTSSTGTGNVVLSNSPTLVTPALGTPASGTLTNATGLPISTGVSGLGTGVATFLGTPSSANLASAVTDETGSGALVFANSPTLVTPALGTPSSGTLTNATGLPISTGVSGLGTGVATFLATPSSANLISAVTDETGTGSLVFATSPTLVTPALGTPSALVGTNITGTASGLTAGNVTTNANLTGAVTSVGNATSLGSFSSSNLAGALTDETGSGSAVFATSPTLVTPILGTPTSATLTNATGLPISTGVSGLGTGVATALAVNTGSSGAVVVNGGALGTPSGGTATNLTGLPLTTGVTGTLPVANGGTGTATPSIVAGTNVTVTGTWPNQTIAASSGGTPGGSTTQVQYNNAGAFGGITGATTNGTALTLVAPVLGTPASATLTNATGLPLTTGVTGTLPTANGGTNLTSFTSGGVVYASSSSALATGSALNFDGTNVNIGNTGGTGKLNLFVSSGATLQSALIATNNANADFQIRIKNDETWIGPSTATPLIFKNAGDTELMRLTSTGLGIGTSSPDHKLDISGSLCVDGFASPANNYITLRNSFSPSSSGGSGFKAVDLGSGNDDGLGLYGHQGMIFYSAQTERARITAAGYVKASDTGTYQNGGATTHEFDQSANSVALNIYATNASYTNEIVQILASRNTSDNTFYAINYYNLGAGAYKFRVADSGNVTNTNNSYGAISDIKLKENILDATPKLEKLNQVRVVNYNFIGNEQKQLGVIAQELEQIFPSMVEESPDKDTEGNDLGTTTKSVKYSVFVPMLIKAIQELKAEFDAYKASHP